MKRAVLMKKSARLMRAVSLCGLLFFVSPGAGAKGNTLLKDPGFELELRAARIRL